VAHKGSYNRASLWIRFLVFSLFLLLLNSTKGNQEKKGQPFVRQEVTVTLKLIQVFVIDNKGTPVTDLTKENFIVLDNGKKQNLTEFEKHTILLPREEEKEITEAPVSHGRQLMRRQFFLFFDFAFNNAKGLEKAKQAALHFIDTQLQPTDEVGVLSYSAIKGLTLHEYLTTDHKRIRNIVRELGIQGISGRAEDFEAEYWTLLRGDNPTEASKSGYVFDPEGERRKELEFLARQRDTSRFQVYHFVHRMIDIARALRYVPGLKLIIFFSSGVPYSLVIGKYWRNHERGFYRTSDPSEGFEHHLSLRYEEMVKELSSANCTIYSLDTYDPSSTLAADFQTRGAFSLQKMTSETGGKYFGNISNYEEHLEKIQTITGSYYVLGYYVDDQWDGKYHSIKVEVDRPGCKVYAQKGYFNPKPFKEYSDLERMLHLVDLALSENPLFQTPLCFPLIALPSPSRGKQKLCLWARVEKEKIQEMVGKKLEAVTILFDEKDDIVKIERKEADFSRLPDGPLYLSSFLPLSPGHYKCRLVIRNLETGRAAVASSSVFLPEIQTEGLRLSPPLLLKEEKDSVFVQVSRSPTDFPFDRTKYAPLFEDLQAGTPSLYAVVRCFCAGLEKPEIKLLANLLQHQGEKTTVLPAAISVLDRKHEEDTEIYFLRIQTEGLQPGEYLLYLFAEELTTGSKSQANTSFRVK